MPRRERVALVIGVLAAAPLVPCIGVPTTVVDALSLLLTFLFGTFGALHVAKVQADNAPAPATADTANTPAARTGSHA